jgi:hypothetical protein
MRTAGVATTTPRGMRGASSLNRSEDARALPYQDDPRHLHTCHIHYARPRHSRARRGLFLIRLLTRLRKGASAALPELIIFPLFA